MSRKGKSKSSGNRLGGSRNDDRPPTRRSRNDDYDSFDSFDDFDDFGPGGFGGCGMGKMNFGMGDMFGVPCGSTGCGWTSSDDSSSCTCSDCRESAEAEVIRNAQRPRKRKEHILSDCGDSHVNGRIRNARPSKPKQMESDDSDCSCSSCEKERQGKAKARARQEKQYRKDAKRAAAKAAEKAAAKAAQSSSRSGNSTKPEKKPKEEPLSPPTAGASKPRKQKS